MPIAPCKDCSNREAGCHSRCPAYISFLKENEEYKKERYRKRDEESFFNRPRNVYTRRPALNSKERDFG